jgi:hypothetical protein
MPGPSRAERVTKGDAEAVLHAFTNAGRVIRRKANVKSGTPADLKLTATIRPLTGPGLPFDGRHYCAEDWHVILVALIFGGDKSITHQDAADALDPAVLTFTLDNVVLQTERGAIKRFLDPAPFGLEEAYAFQQGRVMSPQELAVGSHSLTLKVEDPVDGVSEDGITFLIDAPGTGACL